MIADLRQCLCGGAPQIMINQAFEAYAVCPECGAKGPAAPFPKAGMIEADEFVSLLDDQRVQAATRWNEKIAADDERLKIYLTCDPEHREDGMFGKCYKCFYRTHPEGLHCPEDSDRTIDEQCESY